MLWARMRIWGEAIWVKLLTFGWIWTPFTFSSPNANVAAARHEGDNFLP